MSPQKPLSSTKKEDRELKRPVSEDPPASVPTMEVEVAVESPPPPVSKIHQDTEVTKTPLVTQQILSSRPMTARLPPPKAKKEVTEREEVFK